jgi:hypothetical protein
MIPASPPGGNEPMATKRQSRKTHRHEVKAALAHFDLAKAGSSLNLQIYAADEKIGELEVGRGSLYWYGRNRHKSKRINWTTFAEMMDRLAYGD